MAPIKASHGCSEGRRFSKQNLEAAISLLALVTDRVQDESTTELAAQKTQDTTSVSRAPASLQNEHGAVTRSQRSDGDTQDVEIEELSDSDDYDIEGIKGADQALLLNKALDRLAEILSRYKSDPSSRKLRKLGPSHVAGTLLMIPQNGKPTKILCSKNEGLDDKDKVFIRNWADCMQLIAANGESADLCVHYPNITFFWRREYTRSRRHA